MHEPDGYRGGAVTPGHKLGDLAFPAGEAHHSIAGIEQPARLLVAERQDIVERQLVDKVCADPLVNVQITILNGEHSRVVMRDVDLPCRGPIVHLVWPTHR
jgi:hypothetical protein